MGLIRIYSVGVWNGAKLRPKWYNFRLEFTPLEFETFGREQRAKQRARLEFTPLEFETSSFWCLAGFLFWLEFTPLEFETSRVRSKALSRQTIRIYSVGVWNFVVVTIRFVFHSLLEFTPLEFETISAFCLARVKKGLEFTPLEFETNLCCLLDCLLAALEFTPLEFETSTRYNKVRSVLLH